MNPMRVLRSLRTKRRTAPAPDEPAVADAPETPQDVDPPPRRLPDRPLYVPASARSPEAQRFIPLLSETDEDGNDEDVEFLASLAQEVERGRAPLEARPAAPAPRPAHRTRVPREEPPDGMQVFREMQRQPERQRVPAALRVDEVEMTDLMEQLEIVAAALRRRRKAA